MSKFSRERFHMFVTWNVHTVFSSHFRFVVIFALLMFVCLNCFWLLSSIFLHAFSGIVVLIIVLCSGYLDSLFIFRCSFNISSSENQSYYPPNLVCESLACSLKSSVCFPDFYHSFPIASICRVAPKITVKCKFVVFPNHFSTLVSLLFVITLIGICGPKKE